MDEEVVLNADKRQFFSCFSVCIQHINKYKREVSFAVKCFSFFFKKEGTNIILY